MPSPKYLFKNLRARGTAKVVGNFYEQLTASILSTDIPDEVNMGDMLCCDGEIGLEVKASDDNHSFRISVNQMQRFYETSQGFPLSGFVYAFWYYKNPRLSFRGRKRTALRRASNHEEMKEVLVLETTDLFLVDIETVLTAHHLFGAKDGLLPGRPDEPALSLSYSDFTRLRDNEGMFSWSKQLSLGMTAHIKMNFSINAFPKNSCVIRRVIEELKS